MFFQRGHTLSRFREDSCYVNSLPPGQTLSHRFATHLGPTARSVEQVTAVSLELLRDLLTSLPFVFTQDVFLCHFLIAEPAGLEPAEYKDQNLGSYQLDDGSKKKPKNRTKR